MSQPGHAVFLSYAHEDAPAARRIAEALRAAGIEVWFDQSDLRGGDAWDAKLRGQIKTCALFLPIVSQNTEERSEGYFRREWKLAVDRTNDMAGGRAFLVPVAIDDTPEAGAAVPEEFTRYQWVRLPLRQAQGEAGGEALGAFVAQVKHLLEAPRKHPALKPSLPRPPTLPPELKQAAQAKAAAAAPAPAKKSMLPFALAVAFGAVAISAGLAVFVLRRDEPAAPPSSAATAKPAAAPAAPAVMDKSIAVLPFENRSTEKTNEFFADGVHEDILTNLSSIGQLRVVSRNSVLEYRGTAKNSRQIGEELRVSYLLGGSVRRDGNKLRITAQLIHARTDEQVWSKTYDRDLSDVFAVQSELAREIAQALKATLNPAEQALLERSPAASLEAYDLLLKAREISDRAREGARRNRQELFEQAVRLDPGLVGAWIGLSNMYSSAYFTHFNRSPAQLAKAREAIGQATRLAPDDPHVLVAEGVYYLNCFRDYTRARERFESVQRRWPNLADVYAQLGNVASREGRWADAIRNYRRAVELEPRSYDMLENLANVLLYVRRYDEVVVLARQLAAMRPDELQLAFRVAIYEFLATGDPKAVEIWFASVTADQRTKPVFKGLQRMWAETRGDAVETVRLLRETNAPVTRGNTYAFFLAEGREKSSATLAAALKDADETIAQQPENRYGWGSRSMMLAMMGEADAALVAADRGVKLMPETLDAKFGTAQSAWRAQVLAMVGRKDEAVQELARLLQKPGLLNVHVMRHELDWKSLQGYPPFEALLNDPRNNQPLF